MKTIIILLTMWLASGSITVENLYPITTVVTDVTEETVTVVDFNGNGWQFENIAGDWFEGDVAALIMYDNCTETIYDDIVVDAKYCGWFEGWFEEWD